MLSLRFATASRVAAGASESLQGRGGTEGPWGLAWETRAQPSTRKPAGQAQHPSLAVGPPASSSPCQTGERARRLVWDLKVLTPEENQTASTHSPALTGELLGDLEGAPPVPCQLAAEAADPDTVCADLGSCVSKSTLLLFFSQKYVSKNLTSFKIG